MKGAILAALSIVLIGAGFPASKYELAASFTSAIVRNDLPAARRLLVPNANLHDWNGNRRTLGELVEWMRVCPIKSIEGNADTNINVNLDCPDDWHGMSLEFSGNKIKEVGFGPPPPKLAPISTGGNDR